MEKPKFLVAVITVEDKKLVGQEVIVKEMNMECNFYHQWCHVETNIQDNPILDDCSLGTTIEELNSSVNVVSTGTLHVEKIFIVLRLVD